MSAMGGPETKRPVTSCLKWCDHLPLINAAALCYVPYLYKEELLLMDC